MNWEHPHYYSVNKVLSSGQFPAEISIHKSAKLYILVWEKKGIWKWTIRKMPTLEVLRIICY